MSVEAIIALVGCTATILGAILVAAYRLGGIIRPLVGIEPRVTKLEVRVDNVEHNQSSLFEMAGTVRH